MLVESPLGNIFDPASGDVEAAIDWVDLTWADCTARALRRSSRGGATLRIVTRLGIILHHGDVLWRGPADEKMRRVIAVNVTPCEVLVTRPRDLVQAVQLAFEFGDLHVPIQLADGHIIVPDDGPAESLIERAGVHWERQTRRFEPTLRGTSATMSLAETFEIIRKC